MTPGDFPVTAKGWACEVGRGEVHNAVDRVTLSAALRGRGTVQTRVPASRDRVRWSSCGFRAPIRVQNGRLKLPMNRPPERGSRRRGTRRGWNRRRTNEPSGAVSGSRRCGLKARGPPKPSPVHRSEEVLLDSPSPQPPGDRIVFPLLSQAEEDQWRGRVGWSDRLDDVGQREGIAGCPGGAGSGAEA